MKPFRTLIFSLVFLGLGFAIGKFYQPSVPPAIEKLIQQEARAFALAPNLVKAIVLTESSGFSRSLSRKGAQGLMQLMPETSAELAKDLKMTQKPLPIFLPEVNLRLGCYYLHLLLRKFDGDILAALAAYNTGPTRVARWLEEDKTKKTYAILDAKASVETRRFIKKVLYRYDHLQKIGGKNGG